METCTLPINYIRFIHWPCSHTNTASSFNHHAGDSRYDTNPIKLYQHRNQDRAFKIFKDCHNLNNTLNVMI